jgi:GxxExxY protein
MPLEFESITGEIIGAAFEVHKILGYGFLERVYQRAMQVEFGLRGIRCEIEQAITVVYKGNVVGDYRADLFVEDSVIVELKVGKEYSSADEPQLLNEFTDSNHEPRGVVDRSAGHSSIDAEWPKRAKENDKVRNSRIRSKHQEPSTLHHCFHPCFIRVASVA